MWENRIRLNGTCLNHGIGRSQCRQGFVEMSASRQSRFNVSSLLRVLTVAGLGFGLIRLVPLSATWLYIPAMAYWVVGATLCMIAGRLRGDMDWLAARIFEAVGCTCVAAAAIWLLLVKFAEAM